MKTHRFAKLRDMYRAILIHGNGGGNAYDCWLPQVAHDLRELGLEVSNESFPDNVKARAKYWMPFLASIGTDKNTIIIGHSSGAVAAMRYAEYNKILGSVLVGACYTDLGEASERVSGYYDADWDWPAIKANQQWILQFASPDDPYIPITEARHIQKQLGTRYFELANRGHFQDNNFSELVKALKRQLQL
jgi:predicted alpha/beta hydrolase family esterase